VLADLTGGLLGVTIQHLIIAASAVDELQHRCDFSNNNPVLSKRFRFANTH
jgi:hypothetical protein